MGITTSPCSPPRLIISLSTWFAVCFAPAWAASNSNKPAGCLIEPEQVADVGSPVTGVIEGLQAALGDKVEAGQALVRLRADVERANASVALIRSKVDAEVKAAQANWDLARQKVRRNQQLLEQNFVSAQAVEQAQAESEVAEQKLKLAQSQQQIYAREEVVAQAQVSMRTLRSPIAGVVIERYSNLGERVEDKPVMRIAAIDPLRVSLMVPIAQYGQVAVGNSLLIRPEMPGVEPVHATVTYVDKVVDAASNSFRVRLSLPNPGNKLPGGLRCKADLVAQAPTVPAAAARAPTPVPPTMPAAKPTGAAPAASSVVPVASAKPALPAQPAPLAAHVAPTPTAPAVLAHVATPAPPSIAKPSAPALPAKAVAIAAPVVALPATPLPAPITPTPTPTPTAIPKVSPGMSATMAIAPFVGPPRPLPEPVAMAPAQLKNTMALTASQPTPLVATVRPAAVRKPRRKPPVVEHPFELPNEPTAAAGDEELSPQLSSTLTLILEH
jgi:cobalt-zinc-cadmium efflux system membrane fusion protein